MSFNNSPPRFKRGDPVRGLSCEYGAWVPRVGIVLECEEVPEGCFHVYTVLIGHAKEEFLEFVLDALEFDMMDAEQMKRPKPPAALAGSKNVLDVQRGDVIKLKAGDYDIPIAFNDSDSTRGLLPPQGTLFKSANVTDDDAQRPAIFLEPCSERPGVSCIVLVGTVKTEIPWGAIEEIDKNDGRRHVHVARGKYLP